MRQFVRFLLIAVCYLMGAPAAQAQNQQWQWARSQPFTIGAVATDAQGNAYVTGRFSGTITLGTQQLVCTNNLYDLLVAKYDAQGQVLWATALNAQPRYPGLLNGIFASGEDISVNPATGEAYVVGTMNGWFASSVPGSNLPADYLADKFVVLKLAATGQVQWAVQGAGVSAPTRALAVANDAQGNTYLTGTTYGCRLSNGSLVQAGSRHMYVLSLNGAGGLRWATVPSSTQSAAGQDIAVDGAGGVYVVGNHFGPFSIGSLALPQTNGPVLARLDAGTGAPLWARGDAPGVTSLAADATGQCFVVGSFSGSYALGSASLTASASREGFVAQLTSGGAVTWLQSVGASDANVGVASGAAGPVVVLKRSATVAAVLGLQAGGAPDWELQASGVDVSQRLSVVAGAPGGRVVLSGNTSSPATFGPYTTSGDFLASLSFGTVALVNGVGVYPNPATDQLHLILPKAPGTRALLFSSQGRLVRSLTGADRPGTGEARMDVADLPRGFYLLRVVGCGRVVTVQVQLI